MRLSEAFNMYRSNVIVFSNQSRKTEENHLIVQKNLLSHFGDIEVERFTFSHVRDWKLTLDQSRSPETVRNYIIKLRVVLAYLQKCGIDCLDPATIPVPKRTDKVPTFITKEQVACLINACYTTRDKAIISLLFCSGVRVSELCKLNRGDIRNNSFTIVGKGGKARLCFVDARTSVYIKAYLRTRRDNNSALFLSQKFPRNNERMSVGSVQELFKAVRKRCGLEGVTPHTMRHSFATNLLRSNMNIRYVQELLGHSSLETTQMYTHVINEDLHREYNSHHVI